jgi:osmotically-inducible protein OsmY
MKRRMWRTSRVHLVLAILGGAVASLGLYESAAAQSSADAALKARIEVAIEGASDLPTDAIAVEVSSGVVTLTGSVVCDECDQRRTPTGFAGVQQSLGAVVRAIPGVERVEFDLEYVPR